MNKKTILIGYSGHGYVMIDAALDLGLNIYGYADNSRQENNPYGLKYLGSENEEEFIGWKVSSSFIIGVGDNIIRHRIANLIERKGGELLTLIHNTASVSTNVVIGKGVFINRNVSVNSLARIGRNVILNTGCIVEHECKLDDSVHIAPGAVLTGGVIVGERSIIGANAVVKQGVEIGKDVIVGAGAVIIENIPNGKRVVGNPGKEF
jgi:sugar O-acyltransferase (sialic acid O-acetyltransferase NeuD family)